MTFRLVRKPNDPGWFYLHMDNPSISLQCEIVLGCLSQLYFAIRDQHNCTLWPSQIQYKGIIYNGCQGEVCYMPNGEIHLILTCQSTQPLREEVFMDRTDTEILRDLLNQELKIDPLSLTVVEAMILVTKHNKLREDLSRQERIICDIDLFELGTDRYEPNGQQIRLEQEALSDEEFYTGRMKWLASMLIRPSIYVTDYFYLMNEQKAIKNMTQDLGQIILTKNSVCCPKGVAT